MSKLLYLTSMEAHAGKAVVALGVMELLARHVERIAVFRPIIGADRLMIDGVGRDPLIELLRARYQLDVVDDETYAFTYASASVVETIGGRRGLVAEILERVGKLRDRYDFVLCIGSDYTGPAPATELALNAELAVNLAAPVLNVVSGHGKDAVSLMTASRESQRLLLEHGCTVAATVLNRVGADIIAAVRERTAGSITAPIYVLPDLPVLSALTVEEVVDALGATVLLGAGESMRREVDSYLAGSGYLPTVLPRLTNGALLVASGDRTDLAVGLAAAVMSPSMPTPSGVVFTCGIKPDDIGLELLAPTGIPVATVEMDSYAVLHRLEGLRGDINAGSRRKIAAALGQFAACIDVEELANRITVATSDVVTPAMFGATLLARARADRRTIVLPEGDDERVLRAVEALAHHDAVRIMLLGDPDVVASRVQRLGLDLLSPSVTDPAVSPLRHQFAELYAELRAHKGITVDAAYDLMADPSYFATMLVHTGVVDGMVSGATHTTAQTIRPALEIIKTAPGVPLVSSAFFMCLPKQVLVFADCAVNPDPTAEQLADIAACTADTAIAFGVAARVALVSYSTGLSGTGQDVDKVRAAAALLAERRPDLVAVGPIQYDAAVEPSVAAAKLPGNAVAGKATVLIFPDLNTGNTTYKAVQRSSDVIAIGPVLQGLRRPVNDLSRGCSVDDIINTVLITAIQAQLSKE